MNRRQQKEEDMTARSTQRFVTTILLLTVLSLASLLHAQYRVGRGAAGGWQHLGNAHVDGRADHDRIDVAGGTFTALQMGVTSGAIGFDRVVVHFRNGQ